MVNSNSKGDRGERELASWVNENGFSVIRAPASGSATERELPDLFFGNGDVFIASEVKVSSGRPIYLDGEEVEALQTFSDDFRAEARIAVKFDLERSDDAWGEDYPGFYLIAIEDLHQTDGGTYRVKKEEAHEYGTREVDLL